MAEHAPSLMEDIEQSGKAGMMYLWVAIISAIVSLLLPIVGIVAVYSGYRLTTVMERRWFGLFFAAIGLASLTLVVLELILVELGYLSF